MVGAIIGDIAGSRYEFNNNKTKDFDFLAYHCFFTDDSVMSLAVARALLDCDGIKTGAAGIKSVSLLERKHLPHM